MRQHLTKADYTEMPWANGRGTTIEILHRKDSAGTVWRFSMATVAESGPFSKFPGIERNLTVIEGPGFDLLGDATLRADLLKPIAFPGDIALSAQNVTGTAVDFNVMTRRSLRKPHVEWVQTAEVTALPGATLCIFALASLAYGATQLGRHDFLWAAPDAHVSDASLLAIHLFTSTP